MLPVLLSVAATIKGKAVAKAAVEFGFKLVRRFIDSAIRDKVVPVPGSVVYCDLVAVVEHSGIYVGDGKISNIEVDGFAESVVSYSSACDFTSKSVWKGIYVSCNAEGAVGRSAVAQEADSHIGERSFYGLVFKNCHEFSTKCILDAGLRDADLPFLEGVVSTFSLGGEWERTIRTLKHTAKKKLGATKWRLWDWDGNLANSPPPEPDWKAQNEYFQNQPLNEKSIGQIHAELKAVEQYEAELADENIPQHIRKKLNEFRQALADISGKYDEAKGFLASCPGADFSYADLNILSEDFSALANTLKNNRNIKELARKMGRNYISEEKKKQAKVPEASKSEVHGMHRSDNLMRLLPSELVSLEDDTLETLFYARLLEKNLLTYELSGITFVNGEETETQRKRIGPVVACLDTSGSMAGAPLLNAKASLLAISGILKRENRSLHVLLFGSSGELREFSTDGKGDSVGLLKFLQSGFGGGTDFETPLKRAFDIIAEQDDYMKADVLMLTDGICSLSSGFTKTVKSKKASLDCSVYTVLCAGSKGKDDFSDEVVVLSD